MLATCHLRHCQVLKMCLGTAPIGSILPVSPVNLCFAGGVPQYAQHTRKMTKRLVPKRDAGAFRSESSNVVGL